MLLKIMKRFLFLLGMGILFCLVGCTSVYSPDALNLTGIDCGEIPLSGQLGEAYYVLDENDTTSEKVENCIFDAYQSCTPAYFTLTITDGEIITRTNYLLRSNEDASCLIQKQSMQDGSGLSNTGIITHCTDLMYYSSGAFYVSCSDSTLEILTPAALRI